MAGKATGAPHVRRTCGASVRRHGAWLLGGLAASPPTAARAYTVYVTNEKDNTVSVIDSTKLEVVKTVKVGQRPRGIILDEGRQVAADLRQRRQHRAGLRCPDHGVREDPAVRAGPGAVRPASVRQPALHRQRGRQPRHRGRHREGKVLAEIPVGVEPEGMGISPDGKLLVNTSETTNMAHFIDTATNKIIDNVLVDSRPRVAEFTADGGAALGQRRDRRHGDASSTRRRARSSAKIGFKIPGVNAGRDPAGRRAHHQGRQARLRRARARPIASP